MQSSSDRDSSTYLGPSEHADKVENKSSNFYIRGDLGDFEVRDQDGEESENILDDSDTMPDLDRSQRLNREEPNKPMKNDQGSSHISNVTRLKPRSIEMIAAEQNRGFPVEHQDEVGPATKREILAKQYDEIEDIHQRLVNDKDAVTREARLSQNVSSLRPHAKDDYFGHSDMDERSNIMVRNETKATKVRNTMAPTTSAQQLRGPYPRQASNLRSENPSKTPSLYDQKKRSQPFLNSDKLSSQHSNNYIETAQKLQAGDYGGVIGNLPESNRSRTVLQNRIGQPAKSQASGQPYHMLISTEVTGMSKQAYLKMNKESANYGSSASLLNSGKESKQVRVSDTNPPYYDNQTSSTLGQSVRVSNRSPSKVGSRASKQSQNHQGGGTAGQYAQVQNFQSSQEEAITSLYSNIVDRSYINSQSINKTADQTSRKSNTSNPLLAEEATQAINLNGMVALPTKSHNHHAGSNFQKVNTQERLPTKETVPIKPGPQGRNHNLGKHHHTRNDSSIINQSIQYFKGIFGTKDYTTQEKDEEQEEAKGGQHSDRDDDASSILYCETEHKDFDNKMHPTKIVEKNWVDSYKLAQLIEQQSKWLDEETQREIFGGISHFSLDKAFAYVRCNSSAGYKSPKGCGGSRGSINPIRQTIDQMSTLPRPLSSQRIDVCSQEGPRDLRSVRQMEMQKHQLCFNNDNDSQKSSPSQGGSSSDRSERFVAHFMRTQNKVDNDSFSAKKTNILAEMTTKKISKLEETRRLEQTMTSDRIQRQEPSKPDSQVVAQPVPQLPKLMQTVGTTEGLQTQESEQIPPLRLDQLKPPVPNKTQGVPVPQITDKVHQISLPYADANLRRQASINEIHNSSINNSGLLDPDDFVMSNTSMSLANQSQVYGAETDRANILKESGLTLHEDSTVVNDQDDPKIPMNKQNHEILNRQFTHVSRPSFNDDTPQQRHESDSNHHQPVAIQKAANDFIMCTDNLQIDAQDSNQHSKSNQKPHRPQKQQSVDYSSNQQQRSQHTKSGAPSKTETIIGKGQKYRIIGQVGSHGTSTRKRSVGDKSIGKVTAKTSAVSHTSSAIEQSSVVSSVRHQLQGKMNQKATKLNSLAMQLPSQVHQPQILSQGHTHAKKNSSTANLLGLNRSGAETNLNTSSLTAHLSTTVAGGSQAKKQASRQIDHDESINSINHKIQRSRFIGQQEDRHSISNTSMTVKSQVGKKCRQKKSITTSTYLHKDHQSHLDQQQRSESRHKFRLLHQSHDNFNSQTIGSGVIGMSGSGVSSSMEFSSNQQSHPLRSHNSTVVSLKPKPNTVRGKSNLSSGKSASANASASGKAVIPKTPQTSSKLKVLSAKKQKSVCTSSIFEEGPSSVSFSHNFNSKRRSKQSVNSVNQSMNLDSNAHKMPVRNSNKVYGSPSLGVGVSGNHGHHGTTSSSQVNFNYQSNTVARSLASLEVGNKKYGPNGGGSGSQHHAASSVFQQPRASDFLEARQNEIRQKGRYRHLNSGSKQQNSQLLVMHQQEDGKASTSNLHGV